MNPPLANRSSWKSQTYAGNQSRRFCGAYDLSLPAGHLNTDTRREHQEIEVAQVALEVPWCLVLLCHARDHSVGLVATACHGVDRARVSDRKRGKDALILEKPALTRPIFLSNLRIPPSSYDFAWAAGWWPQVPVAILQEITERQGLANLGVYLGTVPSTSPMLVGHVNDKCRKNRCLEVLAFLWKRITDTELATRPQLSSCQCVR